MAILADLHLHSSYSGDSDASMEEMIQKAIAAGLNTVCFTEHVDLDYPLRHGEAENIFTLNADSFLYELLGYKNKYADQIEVLFGLECGMQPHLSKENAKIIKDHEYDFILGSVHLCGGEDPYYDEFFEGKDEEAVLRQYFEETYQNIRALGNFDSLAHLDYMIRYTKTLDKKYEYAKYQDILDKILNHLIDRDKALELNTGSLRKGMDECNPCKDVIKRYKELGGEMITVGSDAHRPEEVASGFDKASQLLTDCGFKYYTVFSGRIPMFKKL